MSGFHLERSTTCLAATHAVVGTSNEPCFFARSPVRDLVVRCAIPVFACRRCALDQRKNRELQSESFFAESKVAK